MPPADRLGRPLRSLRLSVTDRCNLRCGYCMPEEHYQWLPRAQVLDHEELATLVDVFLPLGVERVRITGGEPLLRRDLDVLVRLLAARPLRDLSLTTNGVRLTELAAPLREAGLGRLTISLDTLRPERFQALTRSADHARVLEGIAAAARAGFRGTKQNCVVQRGVNDDELCDLLAFAGEHGLELRFIEYMDVGGATHWTADRVVPRDEILARIEHRHGAIEPLETAASAPADRFRLRSGQVFGIIASTTAPFCRACDRARLTADGTWFTCLYAPGGTDLRGPLRAGASSEELQARILGLWRERDDRGAEERLAMQERRARARGDLHAEMHTLGG
jgi:cyclic pyranopterin phosphate synthase